MKSCQSDAFSFGLLHFPFFLILTSYAHTEAREEIDK